MWNLRFIEIISLDIEPNLKHEIDIDITGNIAWNYSDGNIWNADRIFAWNISNNSNLVINECIQECPL